MPVLSVPCRERIYTLDLDTSNMEPDCVLIQEQERRMGRLIGYWPYPLNDAQKGCDVGSAIAEHQPENGRVHHTLPTRHVEKHSQFIR